MKKLETMKELEEEFLHKKSIKSDHTRKSYRNCIDQLLNKYNISTLEEYKRLELSDFENHLNSLPIKDSSYNQHLRSLKAFSSWLKSHNKVDENILQSLKLTTVKSVSGDKDYDQKRRAKAKLYLTDEEIQKMISVSKNTNSKLAIALMGYMGIRREELVNLLISDIHGEYLGISGKGGSYEERKMPPVVKFLTTEYLKNRKNNSPYLIVSKVGEHQITNTHSVYERIKSAGKKAGIDPEKMKLVTPHTLRRSTVCNASIRGVPNYVIKEMVRHKKLSTTEIYMEALKNSEAIDNAFDSQPMPDMSVLVA